MTLPALGESVTEGTVTRWLKQVGDDVAVDEPLLEVSTDKVDTEIPSPVAGTLLEIKVNEDETVEVGAELALIGSGQPSSGGDGGGDSGGAKSRTPLRTAAAEDTAEDTDDDTGGGGEDKAQERAEAQAEEAEAEPEKGRSLSRSPSRRSSPSPRRRRSLRRRRRRPSPSRHPRRRVGPRTAPGTSRRWSASSPPSTTSTCRV